MEKENDKELALQQLIWPVLRLGLGAMWCVSAGAKLVDLDAFVRDVRNYKFPFVDVAPGDMILGYGLPWLELFVGVALILGVWVKSSYLLSAGMFCMFMLGIGYAKYHGLAIHCGCFGSGGAPISYWHFVGLGIGLGLVAILYLKDRGKN
jgi:uncharacterized membrane protein YphA (DoxX/SURF4 family)